MAKRNEVGTEMRRLAGLTEARELASSHGSHPEDRAWSRVNVVTDALANVLCSLDAIVKPIEEVALNNDGYSEAAQKIMDGPLADLHGATKSLGYALSRHFLRDAELPSLGGLHGVNLARMTRYSGECEAECLALRGKVAMALTVLEVVLPDIDKEPESYLMVDVANLPKASQKFVRDALGRVDVLAEATTKLFDKMARERKRATY